MRLSQSHRFRHSPHETSFSKVELKLTFLVEELPLDEVGVLLDVLVVPGVVKQDEKGKALLGELLSVLQLIHITTSFSNS